MNFSWSGEAASDWNTLSRSHAAWTSISLARSASRLAVPLAGAAAAADDDATVRLDISVVGADAAVSVIVGWDDVLEILESTLPCCYAVALN